MAMMMMLMVGGGGGATVVAPSSLPYLPCYPASAHHLASSRTVHHGPLPLHSYHPSLPSWRRRGSVARPRRGGLQIVAEKTDIYRVIGTVVKTARDALDAGTKLVPESVPRPLAQAGVGAVGLLVASFILKSIFSTALFILAIGGVIYFIFFYINKDEGPGGGSGGDGGSTTDQALDEARRIMEKYK